MTQRWVDELQDLWDRLTAARASYLDNINNAQLLNVPDLSTLTAARISYLDNINQTGLLDLTPTRAGYLDLIPGLATASSGLAYAATVTTYTDPTHFKSTALIGLGNNFFAGTPPWYVFVVWKATGTGAAPQEESQPVAAFTSVDGTVQHTAFTVPLSVNDKVLMIHPAVAYMLGLTPMRTGYLDNLSAGAVALAATALTIATWTDARASYLDRIQNNTRPQKGTQATTNVLTVIGAAIAAAVPFTVSGFINLTNMQAGDTFLVIEEIRDQDDVTYIEYARNSYSDVQTSPMIWFNQKMCQGWRIRIQRTAGADRNVTYQFFTSANST